MQPPRRARESLDGCAPGRSFREMPSTNDAGDFRQHLEVETPEHVTLDLELGGIGSRALALLIDVAILVGVQLAMLLLLLYLSSRGLAPGDWGGILFGVVSFGLWYGYFTFFEGLRRGQTPGKRWVGLRVVRDTGHPVDLGAAALRNLIRIVDLVPPTCLVGALLVALHPRAKRLGDLVAGTVVVHDRPMDPDRPRRVATASAGLGTPELSDEEYRLLGQYVARMDTLAPDARTRLARSLMARFAARAAELAAPSAADDAEVWLTALHAAETERRGRIGVRGTGRGAADQLAERQAPRWREFETRAQRAAARGLDSFAAAELTDFAARYREVAADLARLRTYHADPALIARVERLVAAGHGALYREQRRSWRRLGEFVAVDCPAAVLGAARYIAVAFLLFTVPGAVGYAILRHRPALAEELVPDVMLQRAEEAPATVAHGRHYAQTALAERPQMASAIILNNVRIAVMCFAGGALAGIGSLILLAFNGLQLGMAAGHFANVGQLAYLLEFVMGHGVLELFAIWVAGAAGFLVGRAFIAPGELTRGDALVLSGRIALRLVTVSVLCLLVAGMVEGLLSASGVALPVRILASSGSLVLLVCYLALGARAAASGRVAAG
jgi:uncharacterized RDD family membrane protein YckC/uncharacterized membrane protein SpoIIM required for sporulation